MTFVDPRDPILAAIRRMAKEGGGRFDPKISPVVTPVIVVPETGLEAPSAEAGVAGQTSIPTGVTGQRLPVFWAPMGDATVVTLAAGVVRDDVFQVAEGSDTEYILDLLYVSWATGATQASNANDLAISIAPFGESSYEPGFRSDRFTHVMRIADPSREAVTMFTTGGVHPLAIEMGEAFRWIASIDRIVNVVEIPRLRLFVVPGGPGGSVRIHHVNNAGNSTRTQIAIMGVFTAVPKGAPE